MSQTTIQTQIGGGPTKVAISLARAGVTNTREESWTGLLGQIADIVDLSPLARERIEKAQADADTARSVIEQLRLARRSYVNERIAHAARRIDELKKLMMLLNLVGNRAALREILRELKYLAQEVAGAVKDARVIAAIDEPVIPFQDHVAQLAEAELRADIARDGLPGSDSQAAQAAADAQIRRAADPNGVDPLADAAGNTAFDRANLDEDLVDGLDTSAELNDALGAVRDAAATDDQLDTLRAEQSDEAWLDGILASARGILDEIRKLLKPIRLVMENSPDKKDRELLRETLQAFERAVATVGL